MSCVNPATQKKKYLDTKQAISDTTIKFQ
jgi:hypothetical protein